MKPDRDSIKAALRAKVIELARALDMDASGISDDDIRHAIENAIAAITRPEQPDFTLLIGP